MSETLWPIPPNWDQGVQETLEWMTSVADSPAGVEQRMALRNYPRRRIDYTALVFDTDRAFLDNIVSAAGSSVLRLPLWFDRLILTTQLNAGATEVMVATALHEYAAGGGAVAVFSDGPRDNEVVEIDSILSDRIVLTAPTAANWPAGTVIYPLTAARLTEQPKASRRTDRAWNVTLSFTASRYNPWETTLWAPTTYRSHPVLITAPDDAAARETEFLRVMEIIDSGFAEINYADTAGAGLRRQAHAWMTYGTEENAEFRAFLYSLRGRQKALWLPTFTADFDLLEPVDSADTTIVVARCGFADVQGVVDNRRDIQIALMDGTFLYRRIVSAAVVGNAEHLVIGSAPGQNIAIDDVLRISIMSMARLDGDGVEIVHHTDIEGASTCAVVFRAFLDQRNATPWVPEPWPFPDMEGENEPPVPIGSTSVIARVFNSASFDNQFGTRIYPLWIGGIEHDSPETDLTFATGAALEYTGNNIQPTLFLELIATDASLVPLPTSEQPTKWEIVSATNATIKNSVDLNTYLLYGAWQRPAYPGIRVSFAAGAGGNATLDVIGAGTSVDGTGLIATSSIAMTGARTSRGRSTGKWLVQGTALTAVRSGPSVNFGFMSASGTLATAIPGSLGSPVGTGFGMTTMSRFIFSDAIERHHKQLTRLWITVGGPTFAYAIDLDAKKYWMHLVVNGVDLGWVRDGQSGFDPPIADPTLSVGTSYADMIVGSDTLYPFVFFGMFPFSGAINFSPTGLPSAPGFLPWNASDTIVETVSVRGQRPDGIWLHFTFTYEHARP